MEIGTGTSIAFETGFFAEILSVSRNGEARGAINSSHLGTTGYHTYEPTSLVEPGQVRVQLHYDPSTPPPIDQPPQTCTISYPDGSTEACSAFMIANDVAVPLEDKVTQDVTLQFSGAITRTPAP